MSEVLVEVNASVGSLVLNRPQALNGLNLAMIQALVAGMKQHLENPDVHCIVIRTDNPKAFCAGGDMRRIRQAVLDGDRAHARQFFSEEFELNRMIAECPKPYVSLIDGICMGGGLGLTVHGQYRVVTERAMLAMPESAIGYMADVGATYFLPRMPGNVGKWVGLTGHRVTGGDNVHVGWGTHFVPSEQLPRLWEALQAGGEPVAATLDRFSRPAPRGETAAHMADADRHFESWDLKGIARSLQTDSGEWARHTLKEMHALSPHAMALTLTLMHDGEHSTLVQCLANEMRALETAFDHPDFVEGIRAVIVDKDRSPRWARTFDEVVSGNP